MSNASFSFGDISQLLGFVSVIITLLVGAIQRDRSLQKQIYTVKEDCSREISTIREQYVSRATLENHITKIENNLDRIHNRLDELLLQKQKAGG